MRDPHPAAGAHDRLERGDRAARLGLQHNAAVDAIVDVRLAVRHDNDLRSRKLRFKS